MNGVNERLTNEMNGVKEMMQKMQDTLLQLVEKQRNLEESHADEPRPLNGEEA